MTSLPDGDLGLFSPLVEYLQEITDALAATSTMRAVTESVLTPTVKALGAVAGIVLLVDQTDQQMKIAGSQGYEDGALTLWQEGPIEDHVLISDILRMREAQVVAWNYDRHGVGRTTVRSRRSTLQTESVIPIAIAGVRFAY